MKNIIAIDGPSASGKGTIAARVAQKLGWNYLDSGAIYRLCALFAQQNGVNWQDEHAVANLAKHLPATFIGNDILLNSENVSHAIRHESIGMGASIIATLPTVRTALLQRQRDFASEHGLVADGRDMGSVVFPHAFLKIFLTADAEIRAQRRAKQLGLDAQGVEFQKILADIITRDESDRQRAVAPLRHHDDARLLDTSDKTIDESVQCVLDWYAQKISDSDS